MQNRVTENLKNAAKRRGKTADAYLRQIVEQAAEPDMRISKNNRKPLKCWSTSRPSYDLVAKLRNDDGE